jgi:thiol-disulfide isomerase/thioredoxin
MGGMPTSRPSRLALAGIAAAFGAAGLSTGCSGDAGAARGVYRRVRYEGEPLPPPIDVVPPAEAQPLPDEPAPSPSFEPAPAPPYVPAPAALPPPALPPPAHSTPLPEPRGFPAPAPILPGAQAPGKSDADPLFFSFLGREPPDIASNGTWVTSPDGIRPLDAPTLLSLRGKTVLLQFAFLECPSCALMTPHLERWHQAYGSRGLVVLYVDNGLADRLESAKTTVAARNIPYPFFHDPEGKTLAAYGVRAFPMAYLIAPDGKVVWEGGPVGIEASVEERIVKALP